MIIASTGILLGFYGQLRYSALPYRLTTLVHQSLTPSVLAARIQAEYPGCRLTRLYLSTAPTHAAQAILEGANNRRVFVYPGTDATFATQSITHQDWLDLSIDLHRGKSFGSTGQRLPVPAVLGYLSCG